jgi:tRNA 2-thiouridine synthesizing protein D
LIYSLVVLSSPVSGQTARHAVAFARSAIERGHTIHRVFFLDAGTMASSTGCVLPQDESDPVRGWAEFAGEHAVELVICVTSALRYGMLDETEAERYERPGPTINPRFTIAGLGDLVDACASSDRVITFGG